MGQPLSFRGTGEPAHVGIRPEAIGIGAPGSGHCDGAVDVAEYLGADTFLIVACGGLGQITVRTGGNAAYKPGDSVGLQFPEAHRHFFDANGNALGNSPRVN